MNKLIIYAVPEYVCTVKYGSKTLRVDTDFFEYGEKNLRFRKYPATCGRALDLGLVLARATTYKALVKRRCNLMQSVQ